MAKLSLIVNGRRTGVDADPETPLLYLLRNDLGLHAAKFGCGLGQCGACTVLVDGRATLSCITPLKAVGSRSVTTLAIFDATGLRLRRVPFSTASLKARLGSV